MSNAKGSEHMLNRVMTKDNIALAALLETKPAVWEQSQLPAEVESQHQQILVCTAHIHWDPEFCDVKLIQVIKPTFLTFGILQYLFCHECYSAFYNEYYSKRIIKFQTMMLMDQLRRLILNGTQSDGESSGNGSSNGTPSPDTLPSSSITTIHHQNPYW